MEINPTTDLIPIFVSFIYSVPFCIKFIEGSIVFGKVVPFVFSLQVTVSVPA